MKIGVCERGDSNPHGLPHRDLNCARGVLAGPLVASTRPSRWADARAVVPSCPRSSRGVVARPVSNLVSIGGPGPVWSRTPPALRSSATRDRSAGRARQGRCKPGPTDPCSNAGSGWALPCEDNRSPGRDDRPGSSRNDVSAWAARCDSILAPGRNVHGTVTRSNAQLRATLCHAVPAEPEQSSDLVPHRPGRAGSLCSAAACAAAGGSAHATSGRSASRDTCPDQGPVPDAAPGSPAASRGRWCGPSTRARATRAVRYRTCPLRIGSLVPLPTLSSWSLVTMEAKPRYR